MADPLSSGAESSGPKQRTHDSEDLESKGDSGSASFDLESKDDVDSASITVTVQDTSGQGKNIMVRLTDPIHSAIKAKCGIPLDHTMSINYADEELRDGCTFEQEGLQDHSVLVITAIDAPAPVEDEKAPLLPNGGGFDSQGAIDDEAKACIAVIGCSSCLFILGLLGFASGYYAGSPGWGTLVVLMPLACLLAPGSMIATAGFANRHDTLDQIMEKEPENDEDKQKKNASSCLGVILLGLWLGIVIAGIAMGVHVKNLEAESTRVQHMDVTKSLCPTESTAANAALWAPGTHLSTHLGVNVWRGGYYCISVAAVLPPPSGPCSSKETPLPVKYWAYRYHRVRSDNGHSECQQAAQMLKGGIMLDLTHYTEPICKDGGHIFSTMGWDSSDVRQYLNEAKRLFFLPDKSQNYDPAAKFKDASDSRFVYMCSDPQGSVADASDSWWVSLIALGGIALGGMCCCGCWAMILVTTTKRDGEHELQQSEAESETAS